MPNLCQNCAEPLDGDYCAACGQSIADYNVPVGEFAREFVGEAFSLDSRIRHTLKPLFLSPGSVPRGYVAGHRARFVPPIRLYIFASFAMFLLMSFGPRNGVTRLSLDLVDPSTRDTSVVDGQTPVRPADSSGQGWRADLEQRLNRLQDRIDTALSAQDDDPGAIVGDFLNRQAQAMFVLLPAFALLLKLFYRRRLYVHHLVFSIYFHSFMFLIVALVILPGTVARLPAVAQLWALLLLAVPIHLLLGMKRFYEESWLKIMFKFIGVSSAYLLLVTVTAIGVMLVVVLSQ